MSSDLTTGLEALVAGHFDEDGPGCALGVVAGGELRAVATRGLANLEHRVPIREDTVFHIASTSKQFAAYSCALLGERGQLDLDAPIATILEYVPFDSVTTRHLIHHVSGLRNQWGLFLLSGRSFEDELTTDEITRLVARQQDLDFEPGSALAYSNTGYTLLGLIVEKITGLSLRQFTAKEIFEPLGMTKTVFLDDHHDIVRDRAESYFAAEEGSFGRFALSYSTCGATSLNTTVPDLARWALHAMTPEVRDILERCITLNDGSPIAYATGVIADTYRGRSLIEHSGGDAGFRAHLVMFPDDGVAGIAFSNFGGAPVEELAYSAAELALGDGAASTREAPSWKPSAEQVTELDGLYYDAFSGETHELAAHEKGIKLDQLVLEPSKKGVFAGPTGVRPGRGIELEVDPEVRLRRGPYISERVLERVERWNPAPDELAAFAGHFWSDELETPWTIARDGDHLTLENVRWGSHRMRPTVKNAFAVKIPNSVLGELLIDVQFAGDGGELFVTMVGIMRLRFRRIARDRTGRS